MRHFFPTDVALNDILFYSFRFSSGICDSLISETVEERIKISFQSKKSKSNHRDSRKENFLKCFNSLNPEVNSEVFPKINNFLSCTCQLNEEHVQFLFQFDEIITSNKKNSEYVIAGNETFLFNSSTREHFFSDYVSPIDPFIIGFLDYIDTGNENIKSIFKKIHKNVFETPHESDNSSKNNENDYTKYIQILLRISFIKSVCILKMYGKKLPIYLFDGNQLIIKIEPIIENSVCSISYRIITEKITEIPNTELSYSQKKWYLLWKSNYDFFTSHYYQSNIFYKSKQCRIGFSEQDFESKVASSKIESIMNNKIGNTQNEIESALESVDFSSEIQGGKSVPGTNDEKDSTSITASKTTNDVINELLNKSSSNTQSNKLRKRQKQNDSFDVENSSDYVDKLIQQQTMQLFSL
ncbi:hypothetical protein HWI79_1148 [Cryptosporidium felis]|nr:hypothetical protein HWI79_1148 [Cryptosporidium felis]